MMMMLSTASSTVRVECGCTADFSLWIPRPTDAGVGLHWLHVPEHVMYKKAVLT